MAWKKCEECQNGVLSALDWWSCELGIPGSSPTPTHAEPGSESTPSLCAVDDHMSRGMPKGQDKGAEQDPAGMVSKTRGPDASSLSSGVPFSFSRLLCFPSFVLAHALSNQMGP